MHTRIIKDRFTQMNRAGKIRTTIYIFWTILSIGSALLIVGDVFGDAAWNGVNIALGIYLFLSIAGLLGLFAGFWATFSPTRPSALITCISALVITGLSLFFGCSFIVSRDRGVPFSAPIYFDGFHVPIIALYGIAFFSCFMEAVLFFPKARKPQAF